MASKLAIEMKRGETFNVFPEDLTINFANNGRTFPHSEDSVIDMVLSYMRHGGFIQALQVKPDANKAADLMIGFRRAQAALYINQHIGDGTLEALAETNGIPASQVPKARIMVPITLFTGNAEEAFLRNVAENKDRADTTPIDDAHNIRRLRTQYGKTDDEICQIYARNGKPASQAWLTTTLTLLGLDEKRQREVHLDLLSKDAGMYLATKVTPEEREIVMEEARKIAAERGATEEVPTEEVPAIEDVVEVPANGNGKPTAKKKKAAKKANGKKTTTGGKQKASVTKRDVVKAHERVSTAPTRVSKKMADVRELCDMWSGSPGLSAGMQQFGALMLKWADGGLKDQTFTNKADDLFKTKV